MTAMKKMTAFVGLAFAAELLAAAAQAEDTIKIGAPFNVTGGLSSLDAPALNGAKLKAKEINDAGGVPGKNVYLLRDNAAEYTVLLAKYFEEAFTHAGGQIIGKDDYKTGDKTFTAQITKIKASAQKPDVVYVSAMPDEIGLIVKQMRQAGVTQPIVGGDGYDTPLLVQVGGKAADDVYFSTHAYMATDSTPAIQKFYKD